jgi:hypothetical protein
VNSLESYSLVTGIPIKELAELELKMMLHLNYHLMMPETEVSALLSGEIDALFDQQRNQQWEPSLFSTASWSGHRYLLYTLLALVTLCLPSPALLILYILLSSLFAPHSRTLTETNQTKNIILLPSALNGQRTGVTTLKTWGFSVLQ